MFSPHNNSVLLEEWSQIESFSMMIKTSRDLTPEQEWQLANSVRMNPMYEGLKDFSDENLKMFCKLFSFVKMQNGQRLMVPGEPSTFVW
jgi:hypothetical protein